MATLSGGGGGEAFPEQVIRSAGNYTVPAGYNAIVRASARAGQYLSIGGGAVLQSDNVSWNTIYNVRNPESHSYRVNSTHVGYVIWYGGAGATSWLTGAGTANTTAYDRNAVSQTYKVPEGTAISGNATYLVELYPI